MSTRPSGGWLILLLLCLTFVGTVVVGKIKTYLASQNITTTPKSALEVVQVPSANLLESAWPVRKHWLIPSSTRVLIAPHHLIASKEIASLFSSLPFQPSTVFIVSPDHFFQGRTTLTTALAAFVSPQATSTVPAATVTRLLQSLSDLQNNPTIFAKEHGVHALLPFMHKTWPTVPVVPIAVRDDATSSTLARLTYVLSDELTQDPKALLVISMDFSHYLPVELADFHDERTIVALRALDADVVPNLETDVPGPLIVGLQIARALGLGDVRIHAHTNSLRIAKARISQDSTSHVLASFSTGAILDPPGLSTRLVFGRYRKDVSDPFVYLRGPEGRLLRGQDETIIDRPDERFPNMLVAEIQTSTSTRQFLFPLIDRPHGTDFLTGDARRAALEKHSRLYAEPLRSQIRGGVVEWEIYD